MFIEYLATIGHLQVKDGNHRHIVAAESDTSGEHQLIQDLAAALWAIPETRDTTPHNKIVMRTEDGSIRVDGRAIGPDDDASPETPEVQAALDVFYGAERDSDYAIIYRAAQAGEAKPDPSESELLEMKRGEVLRNLAQEFGNRMWSPIQTADKDGVACTIQFRDYADRANFSDKSISALGKKLSNPQATVTYRTEDNQVRTFLAADFYALAETTEAAKSQLVYAYGDKRIEVARLATLAELNDYDVQAGWPV